MNKCKCYSCIFDGLTATLGEVHFWTLYSVYHFQHCKHCVIFNTLLIQTLCSLYTFEHYPYCSIFNIAQNCIILRHSFLPLSFISAQCHAFTAWPHDCASQSALLAREIKIQPLRNIDHSTLHRKLFQFQFQTHAFTAWTLHHCVSQSALLTREI